MDIIENDIQKAIKLVEERKKNNEPFNNYVLLKNFKNGQIWANRMMIILEKRKIISEYIEGKGREIL